MKELKAKIDEFDATKNKLTEMIQQKETLQCQWTDVNQVQNNFLEFSQIKLNAWMAIVFASESFGSSAEAMFK